MQLDRLHAPFGQHLHVLGIAQVHLFQVARVVRLGRHSVAIQLGNQPRVLLHPRRPRRGRLALSLPHNHRKRIILVRRQLHQHALGIAQHHAIAQGHKCHRNPLLDLHLQPVRPNAHQRRTLHPGQPLQLFALAVQAEGENAVPHRPAHQGHHLRPRVRSLAKKLDVAFAAHPEARRLHGIAITFVACRAYGRQQQHHHQRDLHSSGVLCAQRATAHRNPAAHPSELLLRLFAVVFRQPGVQRQGIIIQGVTGKRVAGEAAGKGIALTRVAATSATTAATAVKGIVEGWLIRCHEFQAG